MTVNAVSTIFGLASMKMERVSLPPWLIIELSPASLGTTGLWQHWDDVLNMSVNGASRTFGLALWKMEGLRGDIKQSSNQRPHFYASLVTTTSRLCPNNEHQRSFNDFWPCILENATVVWRHWPIIELLAAFQGQNAYYKIVTMSQNECQQSANDFWSCIVDNLTAMEHR
jgi:hypothetical protein